MKVVMLHGRNFPPEPRIQNEAETLIGMGFEVHMVCLNKNDGLAKKDFFKNINIHRIKISKLTYKLSALAFSFPFFHNRIKSEIFSCLTEINPDILHFHNMEMAPIALEYKEKNKLPVVFDVHENKPEIMKFYPHLKTRLNKLLINLDKWKVEEKKFLEQADYNIVVANEATDYYVEHFDIPANKFIEVSNTVTKSFYENPKLDATIIDKYKDCFTLLYLGDTGKRRGLLTALESLKILKNTVNNIKLLIVGNSNFDSELNNFVVQSKLENYVDFAGWQDFSLFPSFIAASKIGICPIHRNIHHDTTFANKIFQYIAFGKPIVVSDCPPQKRIVETYSVGEVHKAEDAISFADAVKKVYEDEALYETYSKNAKKAIEQDLSFDKMNEKFIQLYSTLKGSLA